MRIALKQTAVYWAQSSTNEFGEPVFSEPVEVDVRWADKQELFIDAAGKELTSTAVVVSITPLALNGYLMLGTLDSLSSGEENDPTSVSSAKMIRGISRTPNLKNTFEVCRSWL